MVKHPVVTPFFVEKALFHHYIFLDVRWGDMDAYKHVNNASYFRYLESARFAYFEEHCLPLLDGKMPKIVVANISCRFERSVVYPARLMIRSSITRLGNSSFDFCSEIYQKDKRVAQAVAVMVWIDQKTQRPMRIPPCIVAYIQELESL